MNKKSKKSTAGRDVGISEIESALLERLIEEPCSLWRFSHDLLRKTDQVHQCSEVRHDLGKHTVSLSVDPWPWRAIGTVKLAEGGTGETGRPEEHRLTVDMPFVWISAVSPWDTEEFRRRGPTTPSVLEAVIHPKSVTGVFERRFYCGLNTVRLIDRAADDKVMFENQGKGFEYIGIRPIETQSEFERFSQDLAGFRKRWSAGETRAGSGGGKPSGKEPVGERKGKALRSLWRAFFARDVAVTACDLGEQFRDDDPLQAMVYRIGVDLAIGNIAVNADTVSQLPSSQGAGASGLADDGVRDPTSPNEIVKQVHDTVVKGVQGMVGQPRHGASRRARLAMQALLKKDVSVGVATYWTVLLLPGREWPGVKSPLQMYCASMAVRRADGGGDWQIREYFAYDSRVAVSRMMLDVSCLGSAGRKVVGLGVYRASADQVAKVSALVEETLKETAGSAVGAAAGQGLDAHPEPGPEAEHAAAVAEKS